MVFYVFSNSTLWPDQPVTVKRIMNVDWELLPLNAQSNKYVQFSSTI